MSREVTATKYLEVDSSPISGYGFSVAAWGLRDDTANLFEMVWIGDKDSTNNWFCRLGIFGTVSVEAQSRGTTAVTALITTGLPAANTWFHVGGTFNANNSRAVWLNGGGKATNTGTANPVAPDRLSIGRAGDSSPEASSGNNLVAWVTIWNVIHPDAVMERLPFVPPWQVAPQNIVYMAPLWGLHGPEIDLSGGNRLVVVTGSSLKGANDPLVGIWTAMPPEDEAFVPASVAMAWFSGRWTAERWWAEWFTEPTEAPGGGTEPISFSGSLTPAGVVTRKTAKPLTGSI